MTLYENPDGASAPELNPVLLDQWWNGELTRVEADILQALTTPSIDSDETEEKSTSCQS